MSKVKQIFKSNLMKSYNTLSEIVSSLKSRGYNIDFNLGFNGIAAHQCSSLLAREKFQITEVYRFEGEIDPADEVVVYAIESIEGLKGILVNGYGIYSDPYCDDLIKNLSFGPATYTHYKTFLTRVHKSIR